MSTRWIGGAVVALAVTGMGSLAHATSWQVSCPGAGDTTITVGATTGDFGSDPGSLIGSGAGSGAPDALGALLGTPEQAPEASVLQADFGATLASGDTIQITGMCNQPVDVRTSSLTIFGSNGDISIASGPPSSAPSDGDLNQFIVEGAHRTVLNDLTFGSGSGLDSQSSGYGYGNYAALTVVEGAEVALENSEVVNNRTRGIFVTSNSAVHLLSSLVTANGGDDTDQDQNMGIEVTNDSSVTLGVSVPTGTITDSDPSSVTNNTGDGIRLENGSSLALEAGTVSGNGSTTQTQIFAATSSSVLLDGRNSFSANGNAPLVSVAAPSGNTGSAIQINSGSSLLAENQVSITATTSGTAIWAMGSSTVMLEQALVSGGTITVEVTGGALLALAGGNSICNGTLQTSTLSPACTLPSPYTGADDAIQVDHVGALYDVGPIAGFNFTAATNTITGNGALELQSTADLGSAGVTPSVSWTTGAAGIDVSQNSSFRLEGGATITGKVSLSQGSNGFVNTAKNSTANTVSGGITCPFTAVPASHLAISSSGLNSPPTLATSYTAAASMGSGTCLEF